MNNPEAVLIIGAGQAGGCAAAALRDEGYAGRIILVGAEAHRPYERPPLSKAVLANDSADDSIFLHKTEAHEALKLDYLPDTQVTRLDIQQRLAHTSDGGQIAWDRCLIATGGRARLMPGVPEGAPHVHYLRDLEDARRLRNRLTPGGSAIVIGGGFLGLEFAAAAREKGMAVTVFEMGSQLLGRAAPALFALWLQTRFEAAGVRVVCNAQVSGIRTHADGGEVELADGNIVSADFLLVSIGQLPNTELAAESGIALDNGIAVDEQGATSAPGVYAAGDCASHVSRFLGRRVRLESWQNAQEQAIIAARAMLGKPAAYQVIPWFWSDQLGMNMQMLGLPDAALEYAVRGDMNTRGDADNAAVKFSIYGFDGERLRYVLSVNSGGEIRPLRNLLESGRAVDRALLLDASRPIRDIVKQALA